MSFRGASAQVQCVWSWLQNIGLFAESCQHSHGHQASPLQTLPQLVHYFGWVGPTRSLSPHTRKTPPLYRVRLCFCWIEQAQAPHAMPHGRKTLPMSTLYLRQSGYIQVEATSSNPHRWKALWMRYLSCSVYPIQQPQSNFFKCN